MSFVVFGERWEMGHQEIEQTFTNSGWELDGSFADHLVIGYDGDGLSILVHREEWETDDPTFEIIDHERILTYWVKDIYTPQQARDLLQLFGQPPEGREEEAGPPPSSRAHRTQPRVGVCYLQES